MELTHIGVRQFAGNVQSQSRTLFFSGVERFEEMVADFRRNAFAVIGNDDGNVHPAAGADQDGNRILVLTAVPPRVIAEVPHDLLDVHHISEDGKVVAVHVHTQAADGFGIVERELLFEVEPEFHQVDRLAADVVAFVEQGDVFQHFVDALDVAVDDAAKLGFNGIGFGIVITFLQQVAGVTDGGHRIADFVGEVGGKLSERGELGGHGFCRHFAQRTDIQHQQFRLFLNQRDGTDVHGVLEDVDISFKRFVGMILPACHQFAEHDFLLVNHQAGEIGFCLFVE